MMARRLGWPIILAVSFLGAFAAIPTFAVPHASANHFPEAGCGDQLVWTDHVPQVAADGATMEWKAKTLVSYDTAGDGLAAQVLWVGTDAEQADTIWVEAGITKGWQGSNNFRFYTAHGNAFSGVYSESLYSGAPVPVVGTSYRFKAYWVDFPGTDSYRTQLDASGSSYYKDWFGHNPNTVNYSGGYEARSIDAVPPRACEARIDATYVFANKFRRKSDGVFIYIDNGTRVNLSPQGRIYWC
jgi:hypothetical protein